MSKFFRSLLILTAVLGAAPAIAVAQIQPAPQSTRVAAPRGQLLWGCGLGHTYATLQLPPNAPVYANTTNVVQASSYTEGGFASCDLQVPLGRVFYFQPGLAVVNRGAYLTIVMTGQPDLQFGEKLSYIDLPLLLGARLGPTWPVHPYVAAGPVFSVGGTCNIHGKKCGEAMSSTDYGIQAGGGLEIGRIGTGRALTLGGEFYSGMANVFPDGTKNESYVISLSVRSAFGKKSR